MNCIPINNKEWSIDQIIEQNKLRKSALVTPYDPRTGIGCYGERVAMSIADSEEEVFVPTAMTADPQWRQRMDWIEHGRVRIRYDFEFWCSECVVIRDKVTARNVAFVPNAPQRRLIAALEGQRVAGKPIRLLLLKARQWGGSTLVQIYMAWMQIVLHRQWNSLICGHLKDTSSSIKGIYNRLLLNYPQEYLDDKDDPMRFRPFERSRNVSEITGRGCLVATGSAGSQESIRGYDIAMAHLTEVAFWPVTPQKSPESVIRAVSGSVGIYPDTVVVLESTANGVGSYFHTEWLRSKAGIGDKTPLFVPWYEIEIYRSPVENVGELWEQLDEYEQRLWESGLTIEMIHWYHVKRREYASHSAMKAEYPTNDIEAFTMSGRMLFDAQALDALRRNCMPPRFSGELQGDADSGAECLTGLKFIPAENGLLKVWEMPDNISRRVANRYVAVVDVGGIGLNSDFSVIAVIDRHITDNPEQSELPVPEVVAQWRGHIDHDRLAWKAAQIARWYHNAHLVIESNTLETDGTNIGGTYILDIIANHYPNLYRRKRSANRSSDAYGFHTNTSTKPLAVYELIRQVRDGLYIEHDMCAVDEMSWFEMKSANTFGAIAGQHDDIVMTRAIAFHVLAEMRSMMPLPTTHDRHMLTARLPF